MYVLEINCSPGVVDTRVFAVQVCELDIIFSFHKAYALLDEVLLHGELQEANKREILRAVTVADEKVEAASDKAKGKHAIATI